MAQPQAGRWALFSHLGWVLLRECHCANQMKHSLPLTEEEPVGPRSVAQATSLPPTGPLPGWTVKCHKESHRRKGSHHIHTRRMFRWLPLSAGGISMEHFGLSYLRPYPHWLPRQSAAASSQKLKSSFGLSKKVYLLPINLFLQICSYCIYWLSDFTV